LCMHLHISIFLPAGLTASAIIIQALLSSPPPPPPTIPHLCAPPLKVVDERRRARAKLNELTEALRAQRDAFAAQAAALEEHKAALTRNTRQRLKVHFDQYLVDKETAAASSKVRFSSFEHF